MPDLNNPLFQRAFAAISYLAGRRGSELFEPLATVHEETRLLVRRLSHQERERRAEALARELSLVATALEARALK